MSLNDPEPVKLGPACLHLRHKLMYGDVRQAARGLVDSASDTTVYFCIRTCEGLGPDDEPVDPRSCAPGRSCYCPGA